MKTVLAAFIVTILAGSGVAVADVPGFEPALLPADPYAATTPNPQQLEKAKKYADQIPQTLVVRKNRMGEVEISHQQQKLEKGKKIDQSQVKFTKDFAKQERQAEQVDAHFGYWHFFWNYPSYYPTYSYYYPYYRFHYNYYYRPYYSYYDNGYNYYYYGWPTLW